MRSHLLEGTVRHRRSKTTSYALQHAVYYFALDLDELDEVTRRVPLIRRNRAGVVSFRDADHLPDGASDVAAEVRAHLRGHGLQPDGWQITLVTNLRVLGYVFNPASFYLCRDGSGRLHAVIVEVHNTHGERHLYTLRPAGAEGEAFSASMDKDFYVSPFISSEGRYHVTVRDEPDGVRIGINLRQERELVLATSLVLVRRRLSTRSLVWMLVRHPLITHGTIAMIHWHALRLFRRGVRFHPHGAHRRRPLPMAVRSGKEALP
jgi:uncharacterized protein